jgi:hypothetical protein
MSLSFCIGNEQFQESAAAASRQEKRQPAEAARNHYAWLR